MVKGVVEITHSLPLSIYTAPGGLRQGRGRAAQSTVRGQDPTDGSGELMQGPAVVVAGRGPTGLGWRASALSREGERMGCYVLGFQEIDQAQVDVVGGKGAHLG